MFPLEDIADAIAGALRGAARRADEEQAPLGIDALDELAIHPLLHAAFRAAGFGVHPEQRYPAERGRAKRTEGERCDIVLTGRPDEHLLDPLASGTLFGDRGVPPGEALWLEVKVIGQFHVSGGVGRANPQYSGRLLGEVMRDVKKLAADEAIARAALALVLFNADEAVARHDLDAWFRRAIRDALPVAAPIVRRFPIADRIGNACGTVALFGVHHL